VALLLFTLGLFCKTTIATFPGAILVLAWWRRGRISLSRDAAPLLPFFVIGAALAALTAWVEHDMIGAQGAQFNFSILDRILIAGRVVWFYFGKLLFPDPLVFIYPRWTIDAKAAWQYAFPLTAAGLVFALWHFREKIGRGPLAATLFFGGTLFPVLGFLNVYPFVFSFVADHFQYMASIGVITFCAALAAMGMARLGIWGRPAGNTLCAALLVTLAFLSHRHAQAFASAQAIYLDTLAKNPNCSMAHNNYGVSLRMQKQFGPAKEQFVLAIQTDELSTQARVNLANLLMISEKEYAQALPYLDEAIRIAPGDSEARRQKGIALYELNRFAEAIDCFDLALQLKARDAVAHGMYGAALLKLGQVDPAIAQLREAVKIDPADADALGTLAIALAQRAQIGGAIQAYQQALKYDPKNLVALNNLAWIYATNPDPRYRNGKEALRLALAATEQSQGSKEAVSDLSAADTLAAAYAELGQFDKAVDVINTALKRSPEAPQNLVADLRRRMELYQAQKPYREGDVRTSEPR
jgi:tetratricopeptide (TPR) repeat protein